MQSTSLLPDNLPVHAHLSGAGFRILPHYSSRA